MRRNAIVTVAVAIALLALLAQLAIPAYLSSEVEDRLTENGGSAHAEIHAFPATELIGGGGDRIEIRGQDLRFDLPTSDEDVFGRLDEFGEADVELTNSRVGPFAIARFELKRDADGEPYELVLEASSTAKEITEYAGSTVGGPLGGFLGRVGGGMLPFDDERIPVTINAQIESRDGQAEVIEASGDVAGLPAGPVAEALAGAVAGAL
jgi:hypothetical protein